MIKRAIVVLSFVWLAAVLLWIAITLLAANHSRSQISELKQNVSSAIKNDVFDYSSFIDRITIMSKMENFGGTKVETEVPLVRGAKIRLVAPGDDFVRLVYVGTSIADGHCIQATIQRTGLVELESVNCSSVFN